MSSAPVIPHIDAMKAVARGRARLEVVATCAIEGKVLNAQSVRASTAKRLGLVAGGFSLL